ncbi:MAG: hypothetical protein ACR2KT_13865 [Methylocella sp.]
MFERTVGFSKQKSSKNIRIFLKDVALSDWGGVMLIRRLAQADAGFAFIHFFNKPGRAIGTLAFS